MKSEGLGDSIRKFTVFTGIDTLATLAANLLGEEDCGCDKRKVWLNEQFPYKVKDDGDKH